MAQRIIKAIFYRPGPPGPPGNLPGLYYTAEEIDEFLGDYALTTALDALLPKADVLNEPDMATGATDKPPSQASVVEYVTDGLATKLDDTLSPALLLSPDGSRNRSGPVIPGTSGTVGTTAGQYGTAWDLAGGGYITFPTAGHVDPAKGTILLRLKRSALASTTGVYDATTGTNYHRISLSSARVPFTRFGTSTAAQSSDLDALQADTFHVLAATWGADGHRAYMDGEAGVLYAEGPSSSIAATAAIGATVAGDFPFSGVIESVLIYPTVLPAAEIARLSAMDATWTWETARLRSDEAIALDEKADIAYVDAEFSERFEDIPDESGWRVAFVDQDDRVVFGIRTDNTTYPEFEAGGDPDPEPTERPEPVQNLAGVDRNLRLRERDGSVRRVTSTVDVAFWGDSLFDGYPKPPFNVDQSNTLPGVFASLYSGGSVFNGGISGQTADEIALRQGGLVVELVPAGGEIPASGSVTMTTTQELTFRTSYGWSSAGTIAGVAGTLAVDSATTFTFTRSGSGDAVPISEPTPFVPVGYTDYHDAIQVIIAGRNDVTWYSGDERIGKVVTATSAMVNAITARYPRVVLLGTLTATDETVGSANHRIVTTINETLAGLYPDLFMDFRRWLIDEAMGILGLTPDAADLNAIAGDTIPPSLMEDTRHYSPATAAAAAQWIYDEMQTRGWIA